MYGVLSVALSQLPFMVLLDPYAAAVVQPATTVTTPTPFSGFCSEYAVACAALLDGVACPPSLRMVTACGGGNNDSVTAFDGHCLCGRFDASVRVGELLVDSQVLLPLLCARVCVCVLCVYVCTVCVCCVCCMCVRLCLCVRVYGPLPVAQIRGNVSASTVFYWPATGGDSSDDSSSGVRGSFLDPANVFDPCLSFENLCDHALTRVGCPAAGRVNIGCRGGGLSAYGGVCSCGTLSLSGSVAKALMDAAVARRTDIAPYIGCGFYCRCSRKECTACCVCVCVCMCVWVCVCIYVCVVCCCVVPSASGCAMGCLVCGV